MLHMTHAHVVELLVRQHEARQLKAQRDVAAEYRRAAAATAAGADADDVVQVTWGRALLHLDRLDDPGAVAGWLAVTARREAMRTLQRGVRELPAAEMPEPACSAPAPDQETIERERGAHLRAAIARLSGRQRELLTLLVDRPDLSYEEVSQTIGMPVGSIGPTRERAFERLRSDTALACAVAA